MPCAYRKIPEISVSPKSLISIYCTFHTSYIWTSIEESGSRLNPRKWISCWSLSSSTWLLFVKIINYLIPHVNRTACRLPLSPTCPQNCSTTKSSASSRMWMRNWTNKWISSFGLKFPSSSETWMNETLMINGVVCVKCSKHSQRAEIHWNEISSDESAS